MNSAVPARGPSATLKALVADAKTAARERNWATALALGDAALSRFEDAVPSVLYRIMSKAYRGEDRVPEAFAILMRGWAGRRGDDGLVEEIAGLAGSFHSLSDAATFVRECGALIDNYRREAPPIGYVKLSQAHRRLGRLEDAAAVSDRGLELYPNDAKSCKGARHCRDSRRRLARGRRAVVGLVGAANLSRKSILY